MFFPEHLDVHAGTCGNICVLLFYFGYQEPAKPSAI